MGTHGWAIALPQPTHIPKQGVYRGGTPPIRARDSNGWVEEVELPTHGCPNPLGTHPTHWVGSQPNYVLH
jgi:hypothetical protein